ncbi:MAG: butyryl-CoA dehydrogenase [Solirubrobacteraceae bacterium]|nr:butyryl-CoA dehydrogenase [Solirubrobacteraceae bacterium]
MWRLTDDQRDFRERLRSVVLEEIRPRVLEIDVNCEYPHDIHQRLAREGLLGLAVPREDGGRGETEVSFCAFVEELAKVSGTVSLMAAYVKLVTLPIVLAGNAEQKARHLPPLISGEVYGSYALTEPSVGSDPAALQTRAERRGDVYVLNGRKRFIGNAGLSKVYVVFARTGDPGSKGISAFIVDGDSPGISSERLRTMGMPGWQLGAPRFEDVEVPVSNLLGREGDGFKIAMMTFDRSRPGVAAQGVGIGQGAIDLALDYALRRHAFGRPLVDHQGIQFKLAGMEAEVAAARALTFQAATFVDEGDPRTTKLAAMAKLVATDAAMRATTEAVQVLGGNGYLRDFPAERMMRDAKVLQIYEGSNEIQRLVIARTMLRQAMARDPVWPECMPGAPGVESGEGVAGPEEQSDTPHPAVGATA